MYEREKYTESQIREMTERVFGASVWPTNRGTDGRKPEKKPFPKPGSVSKPNAGGQPGSGLEEVRIIEVDGKRFIVRDANSVFKASSSSSTRSRIPRRK